MTVKRLVLTNPVKAFSHIAILSIPSMGVALLTLTSSLRDAEAINVAGLLRMRSYRLGYDLQNQSPQLNAHRRLFQQTLNSPALQNLNTWYVPQAVKSRHGRLHANWPETNARLIDGDLRWYQANINNYIDQIGLFVLALQHYAERRVTLVFGVSLAGGIGIFTLVFFTLRRTRQQVVRPLNKLVMVSQQIEYGQFGIPPLDTGLPNELGLLGKTLSQMSSELYKLYRPLEASVVKKIHNPHEANRRLEVLCQYSQALDISQIDVHYLRHILQIVHEHDAVYFLELTVGDNRRISEGTKSLELPMQILPVTTQEIIYGELYRQSLNANASTPLSNNVSSMLGCGLYFNQAQKHFQQLLLMGERATIARELHDSLARVLSYLRIQLTLLKRSAPEDNAPAQSIMADFSQVSNDAYRQLREPLTISRLTLQQADLPSVLHEMLETLQNQTSAKLIFDCRLPTLALDAQMQVHLLQIIHEAVLNAIKHTSASGTAISCVTAPDGNHTVYIHDNGTGIGESHKPTGHYGLNIMHEWVERLSGTLTFSQPSGGGTLVSISFRSAESDSKLT